MSFYWENRFTAESAIRIETVMRQSMAQEKGGGYVYSTLRAQGLGYRKTDLLQDYRRFQSIDRSKTPEARARAEDWFEKVYQPLWIQMGRNTRETNKLLRAIEKGTIETMEEAKAVGQYAELYEQLA